MGDRVASILLEATAEATDDAVRASLQEADQLEALASSLCGNRARLHDRMDALEQAQYIRTKAASAAAGLSIADAKRTVQPYLDALQTATTASPAFHEIPQVTVTVQSHPLARATSRSKKKARRKVPVDDQEVRVSTSYACSSTSVREELAVDLCGETAPVFVQSESLCPHCGADAVARDVQESRGVCAACGSETDAMDTSSSALSYSDDVEYQSFSHKRFNLFREQMACMQGAEGVDIPQRVLTAVMSQLRMNRVRVQDISAARTREALQAAREKKYYGNAVLVAAILTGKTPPRLTPEEETVLYNMFLMIQAPFWKHRPPDRKNFMSYKYCLYKLCELRRLDKFLSYIVLLKGKDKLSKQDAIWEPMCKTLKWQFIPSV
jgi:hypothetical protein